MPGHQMYDLARGFILLMQGCDLCSSSRSSCRPQGGMITRDAQRMQLLIILDNTQFIFPNRIGLEFLSYLVSGLANMSNLCQGLLHSSQLMDHRKSY